ncbi:hypothetical protein T492DRAFT_1139805 [Pavlovales sp. CCMP2436]|nr:hypothetical protein T492DRAFT_1139805 [Pavlovales sp. CCMP2436]
MAAEERLSGCTPEVAMAWHVVQARQAEQHSYALSLSTYLHDLAAAEEAFATTVAALAETLVRSLGLANKAAGLPASETDDSGSTVRASVRALANHGGAYSALLLGSSRTLKAEGLRLHKLDIEANRRGRAAQARGATLASDVRVAQSAVGAARQTFLQMSAIAEKATREPPPEDPWLVEVALHAATDQLKTLAMAQDRGMRNLLHQTATNDVVLTNAAGGVLVEAASGQRRMHEAMMGHSAELVKLAKSVDGEIDLQARVRRRLPDADGAMLFCPPTQAPVMASPSAGSLRALSFLRAKVYKISLLYILYIYIYTYIHTYIYSSDKHFSHHVFLSIY